MCLFTVVVLAYSRSRAAWVGAFCGYAFLSIAFLWKKFGLRILFPLLIAGLLSVPVSIFAGYRLYRLKPVSAEGRFLIWQISSRMLFEKPWLGIGIDKFKSRYMYYQADFFSAYPESPFAQIADDVNVPFSEPLKIAIEQGVTGFVVFSSILLSALLPNRKFFKQNERQRFGREQTCYIFSAIFVTLLLLSCFSYPFSYIQFLFLLVTCLAILSCFQPGIKVFLYNRNLVRLSFIVFVILVVCISFVAIQYTFYQKKLHSNTFNVALNKLEAALPAFRAMEKVMKADPNFLISYSNYLSMNGDNRASIEKLRASLSFHASYKAILELGRRYELIDETESAHENWELASLMIPSRFEPLYLRIWNYHRHGLYRQADSLTAIFLQKARKVESIRIDVMTRDIRRWEQLRMSNSPISPFSPFEGGRGM